MSEDRALTILLVLLLFAMAFLVSQLFRNNEVHEARMQALDEIHRRVRAGPVGADWQRHYALYETVSYNEMMQKFWRPVSSWELVERAFQQVEETK